MVPGHTNIVYLRVFTIRETRKLFSNVIFVNMVVYQMGMDEKKDDSNRYIHFSHD